MKKRMIAMIVSTAVTVVAAVVIVSAIPAPQQPRTDKPAVRASDTVAAPSTATKPGTVLIGTTDAENETKPVDPAAIEAIVKLNRVFGDYIYDDSAVIDAAEIILLSQAKEGCDGFKAIEKEKVNAFIRALYGREVDESAGEITGVTAPEGCYAILPCGYDGIEYLSTEVRQLPDGRVEAVSQVEIHSFESTETVTVRTELAASESEFGYIILSAEII